VVVVAVEIMEQVMVDLDLVVVVILQGQVLDQIVLGQKLEVLLEKIVDPAVGAEAAYLVALEVTVVPASFSLPILHKYSKIIKWFFVLSTTR
jgi:hypothetical protein